MALRDRQTGGIPLTKGVAAVVTLFLTYTVYFLSLRLWQPLIGVPDELRSWVAVISMLGYLLSCVGQVPTNQEQAQLFFGSYTGISFSAGLYLLPRLPFPIFSLLLLANEKLSKYFGWTLEGSVSIESITVAVDAQGMTADDIRVGISSSLVFEVETAATFLSQTKGDTDRSGVIAALSGLASARIKEQVIALHTVKELMKGEYRNRGSDIGTWITKACNFIKEFGVSLTSVSTLKVEVLSKRVERAVDMQGAQPIFRQITNEAATAFAEMVARLPKGTSEEVAYMMFVAERNDQGLDVPPLSVLKLK